MGTRPPPNTPVAPGSPRASPGTPGAAPHIIIETGEARAVPKAGPGPNAAFEPRSCRIAVRDLSYSVPTTRGVADVIGGWFHGDGGEGVADEERRWRSQAQAQSQRVTPVVIADVSKGEGGGAGGGHGLGRGAPAAQSTVLCDVSFTAEPSQLVALLNCGAELDPSSASPRLPALVLRALAGRVDPARLTGKVAVDKELLTPAIGKERIGYVGGADTLCAKLTPHEALLLAASLRVPSSLGLSRRDRMHRVNQLLAILGLQKVADVLVGPGPGRGLSALQRCKLRIALALVPNPGALLLEDPARGLDAQEALALLEALRRLADKHKLAVVFSTGQPTFRVLQQIDKVVLLWGGRGAFFGSVPLLERKLEALGRPLPLRMTALERAVELLHADPVRTAEGLRDSDADTPWRIPELDGASGPGFEAEDAAASAARERVTCATSPANEVLALAGRNIKVLARSMQFSLGWPIAITVGSLLLGTLFWDPHGTPGRLQLRSGFLASALLFLAALVASCLPCLFQERKVMVSDVSRGTYRLSSYLFSSFTVAALFLFVLAALFSLGSYWLVGFRHEGQAYGVFLLSLWTFLLAAYALAVLVSSLAPELFSGIALFCTTMGVSYLFSGFFLARKSIPVYWIWLYYSSVFKYPLSALLLNEFGDMSQSGVKPNAQQAWRSWSVAPSSLWVNLSILTAIIYAYQIATFVFLLIRTRSKR